MPHVQTYLGVSGPAARADDVTARNERDAGRNLRLSEDVNPQEEDVSWRGTAWFVPRVDNAHGGHVPVSYTHLTLPTIYSV